MDATAPLSAQAGALASCIRCACFVAADVVDDWAQRLTWVLLACGAIYLIGLSIRRSASLNRPLFAEARQQPVLDLAGGVAAGQTVANRRLAWDSLWGRGRAAALDRALMAQWLAGWVPPLAAIAVTAVVAAPGVRRIIA